jgi:hypothetical protein
VTDSQQVKSALEVRTREREAETRNGNAYMQRAVESLARQTLGAEVKEEAEAGFQVELEAARAKAEAKAEEAEAARKEAEEARGEAEKARKESEASAVRRPRAL